MMNSPTKLSSQGPRRRSRMTSTVDANSKAEEAVNTSLLDFMSVDDFMNLIRMRSEYSPQLLSKLMAAFSGQLKGLRALLSLQTVISPNPESNALLLPRVIEVAHMILNVENVFLMQLDSTCKDFAITHTRFQEAIGLKIPCQGFKSARSASGMQSSEIIDEYRSSFIHDVDHLTVTGITKNLIVAPIVYDGSVHGYLLARNKDVFPGSSSTSSGFMEGDEELLAFIGVVAGMIIRNIATSESQSRWALATQRSEEYRTIDDLPTSPYGGFKSLSDEMNDVLNQQLSEAFNRMDADKISLFVYEEKTNTLECIISQDIRGLKLPADIGILGVCFKTACVINVPEVAKELRHYSAVDKSVGYQTNSLLSAPIFDDAGKPVGVIQAINKRTEPAFTSQDEATIRDLCKDAYKTLVKRYKAENPEKSKEDTAKNSAMVANLVKSTVQLLNCPTLKLLGVEVSNVIPLEECDFLGLYSLETDTTGSYYLQLQQDNQFKDFSSNAAQRSPLPSRVSSKMIPSAIMDAMRSGNVTQLPKERSSATWAFLPDVQASHVIIYPINVKVPVPPAFKWEISSPMGGEKEDTRRLSRAYVLIVGRDSNINAFEEPVVRRLELLVNVVSSALFNLSGKMLKEAETDKVEQNYKVLSSTLSMLEETVLILNSEGRLVALNRGDDDQHIGTEATGLYPVIGERYTEWLTVSCNELLNDIESVYMTGKGQRTSGLIPTAPNSKGESQNDLDQEVTPRNGERLQYQIFSMTAEGMIPFMDEEDENAAVPAPELKEDIARKLPELECVVVIFRPVWGVRTKTKSSPVGRSSGRPPLKEGGVTPKGTQDAIDIASKMLGKYSTDPSIPRRISDDMAELMGMLETINRKLGDEVPPAIDYAKTNPFAEMSPRVRRKIREQSGRGSLDSSADECKEEILTPQSVPGTRSLDFSSREVSIPSLISPDFVEPEDLFTMEFCTLDIYDPYVLTNCIGKLLENAVNFSELGIDTSALAQYISVISENYHDNLFHNFQHATAVVHFSHFLIITTNAHLYLNQWQVFAILLSAVVHDVDHPGNTNQFEINNESPLALRYNDKSVLENHHCSTAFKLMRRNGCDYLKGLTKPVVNAFRNTVVASILATDMSVHFMLAEEANKYAITKGAAPEDLFADPADQLFLCKILLHAADLSNPVRPFSQCKRWSKRISAEFNAQVAKEEELGLPVLGFMITKDEKALCKNELGFSSFVVGPMWRNLLGIFPSIQPLIEQLDNNLTEWKRQLDEATAREEADAAGAAANGGADSSPDS